MREKIWIRIRIFVSTLFLRSFRKTGDKENQVPSLSITTNRQMNQCNVWRKTSEVLCIDKLLWQSWAPLSTGLLYPKFREQTSGIIQKLYETKTNTNTGWFKSVYWLFFEIKPKMCDFACFHCFSSKNGLNCNMTFR